MTRLFRLDRETVLRRLSEWAQSLSADPEVVGVVLFGSLARGDATAASDVDLLVLLRDSTLRFEDRAMQYRPSRIGVGTDVFVDTLAEARQALSEGWGVVGVAAREGHVLYPPGASLSFLSEQIA